MEKIAYQKTIDFEKDYWWFVGRRRIIFDLIRRYLDRSSFNILVEAGCCSGYTLEVSERFKIKVGIEKCWDMLRSAGSFHKACGVAERLPLMEKIADCVLLLDVLEHVDDEKAVLSEIFRVCKPNGIVVITVPAFKFLWSGEDVVSQHKRRYVLAEISELIPPGLKIEKISYFNCALMPLMVLSIWVGKIFDREASGKSNLYSLPRFVNTLFQKILEWESFWLARFRLPFGSSIVCVAKKEEAPAGSAPVKITMV